MNQIQKHGEVESKTNHSFKYASKESNDADFDHFLWIKLQIKINFDKFFFSERWLNVETVQM